MGVLRKPSVRILLALAIVAAVAAVPRSGRAAPACAVPFCSLPTLLAPRTINTKAGVVTVGPRVLISRVSGTAELVLNKAGVAVTPLGKSQAAVTTTGTSAQAAADGGYNGGGCTSNSSCSNLHLYYNNSWYVQNPSPDNGYQHFYHGIFIVGWLVPDSTPPDGKAYDFWNELTNLTNDGGSGMCQISNYLQNNSGGGAVVDLEPTGNTPVGQGSAGYGVSWSVGGYGMGFSSSYNTYTGYINGDYTKASNGAPLFQGTWYWNGDGDYCPYNQGVSFAIGSGIAYNYPAGSSRSYGVNGEVWYQDLTQ